jgi:hypothetical protein
MKKRYEKPAVAEVTVTIESLLGSDSGVGLGLSSTNADKSGTVYSAGYNNASVWGDDEEE